MMETIREASFGQLVRLLFGDKLFRYPEEQPGFQIPFEKLIQAKSHNLAEINKEFSANSKEKEPLQILEESEPIEKFEPIDYAPTVEDKDDFVDVENGQQGRDLNKLTSIKSVSISRRQTMPYTKERYDLEQELGELRTTDLPIEPAVTSTGQILVTWYTTNDQANPQNWSQLKKGWCAAMIWYEPLFSCQTNH
jgi:DHA1 family multidrug resistance protein-like MFS transporter